MRVHEIRQRFLHEYNKLTLSQLSDRESAAGTGTLRDDHWQSSTANWSSASIEIAQGKVR